MSVTPAALRSGFRVDGNCWRCGWAFHHRAHLTFLRIAAGILLLGLVAGCATNQTKYASLNDGSGLEKKQPAPTEGMNAGQKTGYYLGWFSLVGLYGLAGVPVPLAPP